MGSNSSNTATSNQNVLTNIMNSNSQSCSATETVNQNNNVIIIDGGTVGNGVGFNIQASVTSACIMDQEVTDQVTNVLSSILSQSNSTQGDMFGDFSWNSTTNSLSINQAITNYITQMSEQSCSASIALSQSNDLIYAANADISQFVGFQIGSNTSPASANASCNMTNLAKVITYNDGQAQGSQKNSVTGMFVAIAAIIAICIVVLGIVVVIVAATGGLGYVLKGSGSKDQSDSGGSSVEQMALEQLGLFGDTSGLGSSSLSSVQNSGVTSNLQSSGITSKMISNLGTKTGNSLGVNNITNLSNVSKSTSTIGRA